jgi:hypothetical protein
MFAILHRSVTGVLASASAEVPPMNSTIAPRRTDAPLEMLAAQHLVEPILDIAGVDVRQRA